MGVYKRVGESEEKLLTIISISSTKPGGLPEGSGLLLWLLLLLLLLVLLTPT